MFRVTDSAAKEVSRALAGLDIRESVCLRLGETQDGPKMVLGRPHLGDTAILMGDGVSLVIDPATADRLDDREMDFDIRNDQLVFT